MTTPHPSFLSDVLGADRIPVGKLAYFRGRLSNRIHDAILSEFLRLARAGEINKAMIAERIGRKPEQITRWLGSPGNLTIETVSDLLLAMGSEPSISVVPLVGAHDKPGGTQDNLYTVPVAANDASIRIVTLGAIGTAIATQ